MNKHIKSFFMAFLFLAGTTYPPQAQALKIEIDVEGIALGFGLVAGGCAAYFGIQGLINYLWWTDDAILTWAEKSTLKLKSKYTQIRRFMSPQIANLQLFGNRNRIWKSFPSEFEAIFIENPNLAPLHNAQLIITIDREELLNIQYYLIQRELTSHPCCSNFYADLIELLDLLDNLSCTILSSSEYTKETHKLDKKLDRLHQQKLDRERNNALMDQAHSLRNKPDVIVIT